MENKNKTTNNRDLNLNELYQQLVKQKAKISGEALSVLGGCGTGKKIIIVGGLLFLLEVILATSIGIYVLNSWQIIDSSEFWTLIALSVIFYIVAIALLRTVFIFYKNRRKQQKAYKADSQQIADTQQKAFEIHDRLKGLFISELRQQLVWMGFGDVEINSLSFPLGNQVHYDPKLLQVPSLEINKSIEQISKEHALEFTSASLEYYGEDSDLPPYQSKPGYYLSINFMERTPMEIKSITRYFPIEQETEKE